CPLTGLVHAALTTEPLPGPGHVNGGVPTPKGGAVLDGQDVVEDQSACPAGGADVRRALDPPLVPPGPGHDPVPAGGPGQQRPVRLHRTFAGPDLRRSETPAGREPGEPRGPREP